MSKEERSGWRDEKLSLRHREWGNDCPMVDIDFLVAEYDHAQLKAIVEYKLNKVKEPDLNHPSYKVLRYLADNLKLPFFITQYNQELTIFIAMPANRYADFFLKERTEMTEREWVSFLYEIRGRKIPFEILNKLTNRKGIAEASSSLEIDSKMETKSERTDAKTNFIYEVESDLLGGEHIYFVSDDADISKLDKDKVVYRKKELKILVESGFQGEDLKKVHFAKKIFNGIIRE